MGKNDKLKIEIDLEDIFGMDEDNPSTLLETIKDEIVCQAVSKLFREFIYGRFRDEVKKMIGEAMEKHTGKIQNKIDKWLATEI